MQTTNNPWPRWAATAGAVLVFFLFGFVQGEASAIRRIGEAANSAAPQALATIRQQCPPENISALSMECIDLLPLATFGGQR